LRTLKGHLGPVNSILIYKDKLISASTDHTIKIWDLSDGKELETVRAHKAAIQWILTSKNRLISCSDDRTIIVRDLISGQELHKISSQCYFDEVFDILVDANKLIATLGGARIKIWDLNSGKVLRTLGIVFERINTILMHGDKLIAGSENMIEIWDFSFPPLSPYPKSAVEQNLAILEEVAHAEPDKQAELAQELAPKLDPIVKERLEHHASKLCSSSIYSAEVILRVHTEVCVEALLHAIYDEDGAGVSVLLDKLVAIDGQNKEIFGCLEEL
jgi:hypothetical protein